MLPQKFLDFRLSEMVSDALFKQNKEPKQNNVGLFLENTYCKLSRQCPKYPMAGVTCVPHITHKSGGMLPQKYLDFRWFLMHFLNKIKSLNKIT